ncbi:MAG: SHOCT domain-containing protein [Actinomycetota bacterium]|nr:SHOCT domain-containing protein [Actinomycetota bacterium]
MFVRRRPLLRAAAIGGGAYFAGKGVAQRRASQQAQDAEQSDRISDLEQQQAAASYAAPAQSSAGQPGGPSMLDELNQLAQLHQQGALTDAEFSAAKAKLLGT